MLQHPHLGLGLKTNRVYARCELHAKCKGEDAKVRRLLKALVDKEIFRPPLGVTKFDTWRHIEWL